MNLLEETLRDFAQSLGFTTLPLRANGSVVLMLQNIGTLSIEVAGPSQEEVAVSLSRPRLPGVSTDWRRLLSIAHHQPPPRFPLRVGTLGDEIVLAVLFPLSEFNLPQLHEAIQYLDREHQSVGLTLAPYE